MLTAACHTQSATPVAKRIVTVLLVTELFTLALGRLHDKVSIFNDCGAVACSQSPTTYYISPTGDDNAAGTSPATAWNTTGPASARLFSSGDAVLFEGGVNHLLPSGLRLRTSGQLTAPVTISSYGGFRARLEVDGSKSSAISVEDTGAIIIANIDVAHTGGAASKPRFSGVALLSTAAAGVGPRFNDIVVTNVSAAGFLNGISVDAAGCRGFQRVRIMGCTASGNLGTGISTTGAYGTGCYSHGDIAVVDSTAHDNPGDASDVSGWSGSGIVLSGVDGALIMRCLAYRNGAHNGHQGGGPCGIWFWDTNNGTISHCVSHDNMNGKPPGSSNDGCGFDLDGGSSNSVIEYSLAFNNSGPGYLLCSFGGPLPATNLTIRYSVSVGDGDRSANGAAGVNFYTPDTLVGISIYGNTLISATSQSPPLIAPTASGPPSDSVHLTSNALMALGGAPVLDYPSAQLPRRITVMGNAYWAGSLTALSILWGGVRYTSLASFRAATGLEPPSAAGTDSDPQLTGGGHFFEKCVAAWADDSGCAYPDIPNSPSLDAIRGFAGC